MRNKLPEKWYIKVDSDNMAIIGKWFDENKQTTYKRKYAESKKLLEGDPYLHYPKRKNVDAHTHFKPEYDEISYEEFLRLVLNKKVIYELW